MSHLHILFSIFFYFTHIDLQLVLWYTLDEGSILNKVSLVELLEFLLAKMWFLDWHRRIKELFWISLTNGLKVFIELCHVDDLVG